MSRALVILAEDFEELEAISITDILVRGGVEVITAGLKPGPVRASRNAVFVPDTDLDQVLNEQFDLIALPGGLPGADHLAADERVLNMIKQQVERNAYMGAICAAPRALVAAGVTGGKSLTCYPGALDQSDTSGTEVHGSAVNIDLPLITSRGPGTALDFALILLGLLEGEEVREEVAAALVRE